MMRGDKEMRQIALQVSIALAAGMFSIVPVAYGAPVGGQVVNGEASITYDGKDTKINSTTMNNVIDWQDFSVAKDEHVYFDGSTADGAAVKTHNYMNIVTGENTSQIDGMIKGGNEVYIINPNGVIFGETASVDVGSIYASTRYVSDTVKNAIDASGDTMEAVINNTASAGVATDVVNMGAINANTVVMEGQNVRFLNDSTKTNQAIAGKVGVTAGNVILKADTADGGYVHVGNDDGQSAGYKTMPITNTINDVDSNSVSVLTTLGNDKYYQLIDGTNWHTTIVLDSSRNYMLRKDIVAGEDKHDDGTGNQVANFSPITDTFTGNFDGNYHTISDMTAERGLFSITSGNNRIENVGVVDSKIRNNNRQYAGAIAGTAIGTTFINVFNERSSVSVTTNTNASQPNRAGGLLGESYGATLKESYNNGIITGHGLVASASVDTDNAANESFTKTTIKNSYSKGEITGMGFIGNIDTTSYTSTSSTAASAEIEHSYAQSSTGAVGNANDNLTIKNSIVLGLSGGNRVYGGSTGSVETNSYNNDLTYKDSYTNSAVGWTSITNTGGVNKPDENGAVTRPTWRIYEGQSTPVLTSFLKGVTTVNYDYTHGYQSGVNYTKRTDSNGNSYKVGADLTATSSVTITNPEDSTISAGVLTYNGSYMNVTQNSVKYGGGADSSLMSYSNSSPDGVRNAKTKALFHSTQNGYDIVGGNVTMAKRLVTVEGKDLKFSHLYDGATDVTAEFKEAFSSGSGSGTAGGILEEDARAVQIGYSSGFSANFENKNAGENKKITLTGSLTLEPTSVEGAADILANYDLAASSADLSQTTVTGTITQRPIYLKITEPTDNRLNKTYNGNNKVNSSVSASDIFSLDDGTTTTNPTGYPVGTQDPGYGKIVGDTVSLAVGTSTPTYVDVDTAGNITNTNAVNAGAHKILFSGIALTGTDANNYKLQYSGDSPTDVTDSQVFMDGVIRPRLLATDGFQVKVPTGEDSSGNTVYTTAAANKPYDGTSTYIVPSNAELVANTGNTTANTGMLAADAENLKFKLSDSRSYFKDSSGNETDMAGGDNAATQVAYAVAAIGSEELKNNYTFDEDTADLDKPLNTPDDWKTLNKYVPTVSGAGTISRRNITIAVSNAKDINKPYDGNANVVGTGYTTIGGTYLNYADGSDKLLMNDTDAIDNADGNLVNGNINAVPDSAAWNISAVYTDKNVARESDGSVQDNKKTVNFLIGITGADAVNYTLNGQPAENTLVTPVKLEGKGKIAPVTLTPTFATISKTYNGTNKINDSDSTATGVGTVTGLNYTDADGNTVTDNVSVTYQNGYSAGDAYYVSEDYNGNVGEDLAVYYPHLTLAGTDAVNYDLASTTGQGKGNINRRLILTDGFQVLNGGTIADGTKVYDGTPTYTLPEGATLVNTGTTTDNTGIIDGDRDNLRFKLSGSTPSKFVTSNNVETSNVADVAGIAYQIEADTTTGYEYLLGNYKIGTTNSSTPLAANTTYAVTGDGNITRRAITITAENAQNIDKPYDKTADVLGDYTGIGNKVKYADGSLTLVSGDETAWNINATYNDENVYRDTNGNVIENGKEVTFKAYLSGDAANNYTINGHNAENYTQAAPYELAEKGTGTINPLTITPSFNKITKKYTGTVAITDGEANPVSYTLPENLDGENVTLKYSTAVEDAFYDGSGVGPHTITYKGLSLEGAKSGNYKLASTIATGAGQIDKATIGMSDLKFTVGSVSREYDANEAVGDNADISGMDAYIDFGDGNKDIKFNYTISSAVYSSPGTGTSVAGVGTGKKVTYTISGITVPDSILANFAWDVDDPYTATKSYSIDGVGIITPKTVYATINNPKVTKTYNAEKDVQINGTPASGAALVNISGLVGGSTNNSTAVYKDADWGTDKKVEYTIAVSDPENYNIYYNAADSNAGNYTMSYAPGGSNVINTVTTPDNVINKRDLQLKFKPVTKVYDGYTNYGNSTVVNVGEPYAFDGAYAFVGLKGNDAVTVAADYTENANYNSPNVPEAATVTYDKLTINGNERGNYRLVDMSGNELIADADGKYTTTGVGTITKYVLNSTPTISFAHINKEYDGTNAVVYSRNAAENDPKKFINAKVTTSNGEESLGFDLVSATYGGSYVNSDDGTNIRAGGEQNPAQFTIKFSSDNYTFSSAITGNNFTQLTDGSYQYSDTYANATITPRKVHVALKDLPATETQKPYDGTDSVIQTVTGPNNRVYMPYSSDFISGDDVKIDWDNIRAVYSSKDVAYDSAGNVTSKDVIYTVGLTGTAKGNYVLYHAADNTAITDTNKLTGTGIITPKELSVSFKPDVHIYNNSNEVDNPGANIVLENWAEGESASDFNLTAFKNNVSGKYINAIVDRAADGTPLHKELTYTGMQTAWENFASSNAPAKNYTITTNSITYAPGDKKGIIMPLELTAPLKAVWQENVNKTYDATTNLPTGTDANSVLTLQVNTAYDGVLSLQGGSEGYQYSSAGYESKNQGDRALKYTLTGVNANQGNYQLSDAVVSAALSNPWLSTDTTRNVNGTSVTGNISKRQLNIIVETDSKIYDGGLSVANPKALIHFSPADQAVITADADGVDYAVTANYTDKNAGTQDIAYTLTLNGNANGNYVLNNVLNSNTATITGDTATGTTTGDIAKRKVYVTPININNINKEYDTTNALPDDFTNAGHFQLTPADVNTGIVAGDEDIQLNIDAIEGAYANEHAGNKTITFNNFALMDTSDAVDSGILNNYTLETNSIVGSGTISPKALTIGIKAAPIKGYDTSKALSAGYATTDNLTLSGAFDNDAVNLQVNSANYSNAKADTGKTYSYEVSIDNTDYKLTQGANLPAITVSNDGQTGVITANDGTITKRKVYVSLADTPDVVKTYDGNTGVKQDVTDKIIVRSGDLLADGTELDRNAAVINAHYDNKDAGDRTVTYNTKLKGDAADNYEIHRLSNINDAAADVETSTLTGKGVINKAKLTLDPASISKTYNGTSVIGDGTNAGDESLTKDKLVFQGVNNESFTLTDAAFAKVIGQYGYGTGDANVSWVGDEVADKDVLYTGLSDALAVMNADDSTNAISKNYTIDQTAYFAAAQAKGKIKPITLTQAATANWKPVVREYNGETDLTEVYDYSGGTKGEQLGVNDILTLTVTDSAGKALTVDYEATANYDDMNVGSRHNLNYQINAVNKKVADTSGNPNYVLDSSVMAALEGRNMDSSSANVYSVITPRTLTVASVAAMNKEYDGTVDGVDNAQDKIALTNYIAKDKDNLGFTATAVYDNPNAGKSEDTDELQEHQVTYTLSLANPNYQLETDTLTGTGTISRKGLTIVATPASVNMGEPLPQFTGTVEGLVPADSSLASSFTFATLPDVNTSNVTGAQTPYPIYGWYRNSYEGGNFGLNYTYSQDPANETAFTVNYINTDMGNPDLKPTPTHDVYQQVAKDVTSGFGGNNAASLQYVDKNGKVLATETIGSGTIATGETMDGLTVQGTDLANIGIVGGDIVNLEGADAAGIANIEMQDKGAVVNLEVYSLNGEKTSTDGNPAAEIVSTDSRNALGSIQIVDESGHVLEEIDQDKAEKQEKEGEIAIQSSDGQNENEIELTVESTGVNVA